MTTVDKVSIFLVVFLSISVIAWFFVIVHRYKETRKRINTMMKNHLVKQGYICPICGADISDVPCEHGSIKGHVYTTHCCICGAPLSPDGTCPFQSGSGHIYGAGIVNQHRADMEAQSKAMENKLPTKAPTDLDPSK